LSDALRTPLAFALFAAGLALAPLVFPSGLALTMMSLMGVMIIFALSYNMLLGQTGLLSFGHAVYYGLGGAFVASLLIGLVQTFAVAINGSLADLIGPIATTIFGELGSVTLAQIAPLLPYLMLVLVLIFKPTGLFGTREN